MTQQFTPPAAPPPWAPVAAAPPPAAPPAPPQYTVGQIVNGHQLTAQGTWVPVPPPAAAPPPAPAAFPPPAAAPAWAGAAPAAAPGLGSAFGGVADAETFSKNGFFPADFQGYTKLETFKAVVPPKGKNKGQLLVIVESEVMQSNMPAIPQGAKRDQVIKMLPYGDGDLKAVVGAAAGFQVTQFEEAKALQPQHLDAILAVPAGTVANLFATKPERERVGGLFAPAILEYICGPANPFRGRIMGLATSLSQSQKFTKHNWTPAPRTS